MIAQHPPMGWNSWDCYGAAVTEEVVRQNADYMAKHLKQYGWEYVVVDIQWYQPTALNHQYEPFSTVAMDEYGRLLPAENRFPSAANGAGFKPLADYVHALGLKFGIHIMRGIPRQAVHADTPVLGSDKTARQIAKTASICRWNTDMYGVDPEKDGARAYYNSIFALYAEWGVDFVKCDDIARELPACEGELRLLSECLRGCGREMVLSLSPGASLPEYADLYKQTAEMWRISDDFWDKWDALYEMFGFAEKWCMHTGGGHYPDADMLPIGAILQDYGKENRSKFTPDELETMMTLWCMIRSPLMIGGDLRYLTDAERTLLTDRDLMNMHANIRFTKPLRRRKTGGTEYAVWLACNADGDGWLGLFNLGEQPVSVTVSPEELEYTALEAIPLRTPERAAFNRMLDARGSAPDGYDAQTRADIEPQILRGSITAEIPPHGCRLFFLSDPER